MAARTGYSQHCLRTQCTLALIGKSYPDTPETRTLQFLVEERSKFVADKTQCSNRLTAHLKMYFPQTLNWFSEISSEIAAAFLERWPTL
jgi:hypothetical protein